MAGYWAVRKWWVEAADFRHATYGLKPSAGDVVLTLCGETVTVIVAVPGRYARECPECDRAWRRREGIPLRSDQIRKRSNGNGEEGRNGER
jgi:hypothetical protein